MVARVLIVDDDMSMCELIANELALRGFESGCRSSADQGLEALGAERFDVVLADVDLGAAVSGIEMCSRIAATRPEVPVVVLSGHGGVAAAVAGMRAGAQDFVVKPVDFDLLARSLERALEVAPARLVASAHPGVGRFDGLIGASPPMTAVFDLLERIRYSDASVLVTGESGTGKELVARALHHRGRRAQGPFVALNCAAVPENLLESELFGHAQGAFTDARRAHKGLFLQASGGTLFLDEIIDMPLGLQAKLLRVLQERTVRPVGGEQEIPVDVRIIASTNTDPDVALAGAFRKDLFFRVAVVQVELPPLRKRGGDVLLLARHFLEMFSARAGKPLAGISASVGRKLLSHAWPGNVRELMNAIERAVAVTTGDTITVGDLPPAVNRSSDSTRQLLPAVANLESLRLVEGQHIRRVLDAVAGNKTRAAEILGINRRTLYRKLAP